MKVAELIRTPQEKQTLGKMVCYDESRNVLFTCDTIELPYINNAPQISCIPKGTYICRYRTSTKYPEHYHVLDVPNRSYILIHQANYVGSKNPKTNKPDLLGCIGVGKWYGDITGDGIVELLNSVTTLKKLIKIMGKNDFELTIK